MWLRVETVVAAIVMPLMVGLAILAPEFVVAVLGEKWRAAIPVLRILAFVALFQSLAMIGERVLQAIDKAQTVFRFNTVNLVLTIGAFVLGLKWGIIGVAACYAAVTIPLQVVFAWMTGRALGTPMRRIGSALAGPTAATVVMAAAVLVADHVIRPLNLSAIDGLLIGIAVGAVTYLPLCILFSPVMREELGRVRGALSRRRNRARTAALEATGA